MIRFKSAALALTAFTLLADCTAFKVVTHEVTGNTVKVVSGTYRLDPHHWSLLFDVDHFGYSRFVMRFDRMQATLDVDAKEIAKSRAHVTIDAASVDTNNPELDKIVSSDQMFDVARFPTITFESVSLKPTGEKTATLLGNLTSMSLSMVARPIRSRARIRSAFQPMVISIAVNGGSAPGGQRLVATCMSPFRRNLCECEINDFRPSARRIPCAPDRLAVETFPFLLHVSETRDVGDYRGSGEKVAPPVS